MSVDELAATIHKGPSGPSIGAIFDYGGHEPIPTAGWSGADIEPWLAAMGQLYIDTLDDWPGVEAGRRWSTAIANGTPVGGSR